MSGIDNIVSLKTAQFMVACTQSKHVGLIGFAQQAAARSVYYDAISNEWVKVLTTQRSTKVSMQYYN